MYTNFKGGLSIKLKIGVKIKQVKNNNHVKFLKNYEIYNLGSNTTKQKPNY